jgi:hypothetical protein
MIAHGKRERGMIDSFACYYRARQSRWQYDLGAATDDDDWKPESPSTIPKSTTE